MLAGTVVSLWVIYIFRPTDVILWLDIRRGPIRRLPLKGETEEQNDVEDELEEGEVVLEGHLEEGEVVLEGTLVAPNGPRVPSRPKKRRRPNRRRKAQKLRTERQRSKQKQWLQLVAEDEDV